MVLLNALYFNAPWQDKFDASLTSKADFRGQSGTTQVDMMYRKGTYNYVEYQGCQMIELPYLGSSYSMFVVLPPSGMKIDDVIEKLSGVLCGYRGTSCPDQIARALKEYKGNQNK